MPENIKGETKLNQSALKAFCICIREIVSLTISDTKFGFSQL
jgi:hypothetical protein